MLQGMYNVSLKIIKGIGCLVDKADRTYGDTCGIDKSGKTPQSEACGGLSLARGKRNIFDLRWLGAHVLLLNHSFLVVLEE